jgi:long-chain acyl-CoA synthetase
MLSRLLSLPADVRSRYDVSGLTHLVHSAAPCPPAVKRAAIDWFGEALWEFYGCTEAGPITWIGAAEWLRHPGSVGRTADGSQVLITAEDGTPLPAGEVGRVLLRRGDHWPDFHYLHATPRSSVVDGMIDVGDIGCLDPEGYLYLTGRASEVIISGGVNVYAAEVEAAVMSVPGVEDVAVFGIPDSGDLGETVAAHVLPRPGIDVTPADVADHLRGRLAGYKIPRTIDIVDQLPRDDSGKMYKRRLAR